MSMYNSLLTPFLQRASMVKSYFNSEQFVLYVIGCVNRKLKKSLRHHLEAHGQIDRQTDSVLHSKRCINRLSTLDEDPFIAAPK